MPREWDIRLLKDFKQKCDKISENWKLLGQSTSDVIYTWLKAEAIRDFFPSETKTANSITLSGFLHLNTIDIWGQIILCCGGLSCAL